MNNIEGKVVIITGASSGIGEATVKKLGNLGAKIVLAARRKERLEVLKKQIEQNSGHIINISSNAAYTEISPYSTVYCMTKHAVKNISSGLRQEEAIAGSKIRVTDIGPGMVDTELVSTIIEPEMKTVADQLSL